MKFKGIIDEYEARIIPLMDMEDLDTPETMDEILEMAQSMREDDESAEAFFMAGVVCTWNLCSRIVEKLKVEDCV